MTHSTVAHEAESGGSTTVVYLTLNVTSLDAAGQESIDLESEAGVDVTDHGVTVAGVASGTYHVVWDHVAEALAVVNVADGSDVAVGTTVGEIRLRAEGV